MVVELELNLAFQRLLSDDPEAEEQAKLDADDDEEEKDDDDLEDGDDGKTGDGGEEESAEEL